MSVKFERVRARNGKTMPLSPMQRVARDVLRRRWRIFQAMRNERFRIEWGPDGNPVALHWRGSNGTSET